MYGLFHYLLFLCGFVFFWFCLLMYSYTCIQLYVVKQNFKISSSDTLDVHQNTPVNDVVSISSFVIYDEALIYRNTTMV